MRYYKTISDGYILSIGTGAGGEEITEAEYNTIMSVIRSRPAAADGYGYRLKTDLSWELYELPVPDVDSDPDLTAEEALEIIVGGGSDA